MKYIQADWPAPSHIKAYTTIRSSWGEHNPHSMLANPDCDTQFIDESRRLASLLQLPDKPVWIKQTHSSIVLEAKPENRRQNGDASFSSTPNQICAVLTADCLPVLITNKQGTHVAAAHAGWRGLAGGIIENTILAMQQPPHDLLVWLGPAIGPQKFEVGKDVYDAFTHLHAQSASAFISCNQDKWLANLYELARIRLTLFGITQHQIYGGNYCTFSQEELFFSYRRDKGKTGRMASLIWIENN